jgi:hypothetical protein
LLAPYLLSAGHKLLMLPTDCSARVFFESFLSGMMSLCTPEGLMNSEIH